MDTAENLEQEEQETSLREDIESSISEIAADDTKEESVSMDGLLPDESSPAIPDNKEKDKTDKTEEEKAAAEGKEAESEKGGSTELAEGEAEAGEAGQEAAGEKIPKAPVGWSPKARESWAKVPSEAQKMILDREKEIATTLQETATARQTHENINKIAQSFAPIMAAEGVSDPMQAIHGLFNTVAQLRVGTPEQKAGKMAQLIQHYGIDITALDNALVGEAGASPDAQMSSLIDQKMQPVNQLLQELQSRQQQGQQQSQQEAERAISEFKGEFFEDVRLDMADLMDMAAARNQTMTLQEAYDKAILLKPDIQAILQKRADDAAIIGQNKNLENKREAASSVIGQRGGDGGGGGAMSMREAISDAWENQG